MSQNDLHVSSSLKLQNEVTKLLHVSSSDVGTGTLELTGTLQKGAAW